MAISYEQRKEVIESLLKSSNEQVINEAIAELATRGVTKSATLALLTDHVAAHQQKEESTAQQDAVEPNSAPIFGR